MTKYQISFITDKTIGSNVENALKVIYENQGKLLDYLRTKNVSIMLIELDDYTMCALKTAGYDIELPPKIVLS